VYVLIEERKEIRNHYNTNKNREEYKDTKLKKLRKKTEGKRVKKEQTRDKTGRKDSKNLLYKYI
jgi:hypothetical protein